MWDTILLQLYWHRETMVFKTSDCPSKNLVISRRHFTRADIATFRLDYNLPIWSVAASAPALCRSWTAITVDATTKIQQQLVAWQRPPTARRRKRITGDAAIKLSTMSYEPCNAWAVSRATTVRRQKPTINGRPVLFCYRCITDKLQRAICVAELRASLKVASRACECSFRPRVVAAIEPALLLLLLRAAADL